MAERHRDQSDIGRLPPNLWLPLSGQKWPGARTARHILRAECPEIVMEFNIDIDEDNKRIATNNFRLYEQSISLNGEPSLVLDVLAHRQNGAVPMIGETGSLRSKSARRPGYAVISLSMLMEYEPHEDGSDDRVIADVDIVLSSIDRISAELPISDRARANVLRPLGDFIMSL